MRKKALLQGYFDTKNLFSGIYSEKNVRFNNFSHFFK